MIKALLLDLDGTVYAGDREIDGASDFIRRMTAMNIRCIYVTNRANRTPLQVCEQLRNYGIICHESDVITSALATVQYLKKGSVFFIGEEGMRQAISNAGMTISNDNPDYVIVSYSRSVLPEDIEKAAQLIRNGAKFIGTNPDKGLKTESGILPGTGTIVDAVQKKCDTIPVIIGKPEKIIIDMALEPLHLNRNEVLIIGDNVDTDIPAGQKSGIRTVLMLTGISTRSDCEAADIKPDWIVKDFNDLYDLLSSLNRDH